MSICLQVCKYPTATFYCICGKQYSQQPFLYALKNGQASQAPTSTSLDLNITYFHFPNFSFVGVCNMHMKDSWICCRRRRSESSVFNYINLLRPRERCGMEASMQTYFQTVNKRCGLYKGWRNVNITLMRTSCPYNYAMHYV